MNREHYHAGIKGQIDEANEALLTVGEVAEWLRCKAKKVYSMGARGELPRVRIGGRVLFRRGDIRRYIAQMREA